MFVFILGLFAYIEEIKTAAAVSVPLHHLRFPLSDLAGVSAVHEQQSVNLLRDEDLPKGAVLGVPLVRGHHRLGAVATFMHLLHGDGK
jgi:hypothetical protein